MSTNIPWVISSVVITVDLAIVVATWSVLSAAARRIDLTAAARRRFRIVPGGFLGGGFGAALWFAAAPARVLTGDPYAVNPLIPLFAGGSLIAILLAFVASPTLRRVLWAVPLPTLHGLQLYRAVGFVFLIMMGLGQLPAHFALPAGWGDVFIGGTAVPVAALLARSGRQARAVAATWNLLGLLDLIVAVGMGTGLLAPLLLPNLGSRVPSAGAMGTFPLFLVPAFVVPLSIAFHVL